MTTDTPSAEALADKLAAHNRWRRGDDEPAPDPTELGKTIDAAAAALRALASERDALHARVSDYETQLTAVMPSDFKDWHQNSRTEWPEVAAAVIVNQRKLIEHDADMIGELSAQVAEAKAERDALRADNANLRTVMVAAAEEIHAHWEAHCDAAGYGPANLMHRLEQGIPAQYGYTAGRFAELVAERDALRAALDAAQAPRDVPRLTDADIAACVAPLYADPVAAQMALPMELDAARLIESRVRELCGVAP